MAERTKEKILRVGIITDIHLFCHANPARDFARYIDDLNKCRPSLDLILNLGDMGREGLAKDVRAYVKLVKRMKMPVYHTLGNHDGPVWQTHAKEIRAILGHPRKKFIADSRRFLLMPGFEKEKNLAWLGRQLKAAPRGKRIVVGGHHPPSAEEAVLMARHGVEVFLFGHRHVNRDYTFKGLRCLGTSNSFLGGKVGEAEGFRIIEFNAGGFDTEYRWAEVHNYKRIIKNRKIDSKREVMLGIYDTVDPAVAIKAADGTILKKQTPLTWTGELNSNTRMDLQVSTMSGKERTITIGRARAETVPAVTGRGTWAGLVGRGILAKTSLLNQKPCIAWTSFVQGTPNVQGLTLARGRLFCPAGASRNAEESGLTCFEARTGKMLWHRRLPSMVRGSCSVGPEHAYVHGVMGTLHALDVHTGRQAWRVNYRGRIHGWFYTTPVYHKGIVYGGTNADFRAVDADSGAMLWRYSGKGTDWNVTSSKPLIAGQSVIMGMGPRGVICFRQKDGGVRWHTGANKEYGSVGMPPTTDGRNVYFATDKAFILAVSLRTGRVKWSYRQDGTSMLASPLPYGKDELLIADLRGHVYRLHGPSGKIRWQHRLPVGSINTSCYTRGWGAVLSTPALVDNHLLVGSADGGLYCFDPENGCRAWRIELGAPINTSPAVGRDAIYTAAFDGAVHALAWPDPDE